MGSQKSYLIPNALYSTNSFIRQSELINSTGRNFNVRQSYMEFGPSCKNDFERVTKSMIENQKRDPYPSLKSLVGQDEKVMNLRPFEKEKHVTTDPFRYGPGRS